MKKLITLFLALVGASLMVQEPSYFIRQMFPKQNAAQVRQYLGISTNPISGGTGGVSVSVSGGLLTATTNVGGTLVTLSAVNQVSGYALLTTLNNVSNSLLSFLVASNSAIELIAGTNIAIVTNIPHRVWTIHGTASGGGGGGSSSSIDFNTTNVVNSFDATGTNFVLDFNYPAQRWLTTGGIAFRYSTNWPSTTTTSRFIEIFVPQTTNARSVTVFDNATNWFTAGLTVPLVIPGGYGCVFRAGIFGLGETNVSLTAIISQSGQSLGETYFSPVGVPGIVLWLDAAVGLYRDTAAVSNVTANGQFVRYWTDRSGNGNHITNNRSDFLWASAGAPNGLPSVVWQSATASGFRSVTSNAVPQPIYGFVVAARTVTNQSPIWLDSWTGTPARNFGFSGVGTVNLSAGTQLQGGNSRLTSWALYSFVLNGTSSYTETNGVQVVVGSAGTGIGAGHSIGFGAAMDAQIAEIILYSGAITTNNVANTKAYLKAKYSLPLP